MTFERVEQVEIDLFQDAIKLRRDAQIGTVTIHLTGDDVSIALQVSVAALRFEGAAEFLGDERNIAGKIPAIVPGDAHVLAGEEIDQIGGQPLTRARRQCRWSGKPGFEIFEDLGGVLNHLRVGRFQNRDAFGMRGGADIFAKARMAVQPFDERDGLLAQIGTCLAGVERSMGAVEDVRLGHPNNTAKVSAVTSSTKNTSTRGEPSNSIGVAG